MKVRAYLNVEELGLKRVKRSNLYILGIKVGGVDTDIVMQSENGRMFMDLNDIDPVVPRELEERVTAITSRETVWGGSCKHADLLKTGIYETQGNRAEVRPDLNSCIVEVCAKTVEDWRQLRSLVLSGKADPKHTFVPKND